MNFISSRWAIGLICFLVGILLILGVRVASYSPEEEVHYHANFAVFINGQQEQFKNPIYYTEIEESCTVVQKITPHERAHMHDNVNNVVHVEDEAVTWGQFFQNLGWVVDPTVIRAANKLYLPDDQNKISFILNGKAVDNIVRTVINDEDRLLVNYGIQSQSQLSQEFKTIPSTAHKYDVTSDPASCSGRKNVTMSDRLKHMF